MACATRDAVSARLRTRDRPSIDMGAGRRQWPRRARDRPSSASRHSTSSRSTAPPEKVSVTTPAGASVSANSTASRLRTASLLGGIDVPALAGQHPLETQRRAAAAQFRRRSRSRPSSRSGRAPSTRRFSCGRQMHIGDLDLGILQMGGNDLEVVLVEGDELDRRLHGPAPCRRVAAVEAVVREPVAPAQARCRVNCSGLSNNSKRYAGWPHDDADRLLVEAASCRPPRSRRDALVLIRCPAARSARACLARARSCCARGRATGPWRQHCQPVRKARRDLAIDEARPTALSLTADAVADLAAEHQLGHLLRLCRRGSAVCACAAANSARSNSERESATPQARHARLSR